MSFVVPPSPTDFLGKRRTANHPCPVCGKHYVNEGSLRKHLACHPETSQLTTSLRMWPCSVCQAVFTHESGNLIIYTDTHTHTIFLQTYETLTTSHSFHIKNGGKKEEMKEKVFSFFLCDVACLIIRNWIKLLVFFFLKYFHSLASIISFKKTLNFPIVFEKV